MLLAGCGGGGGGSDTPGTAAHAMQVVTGHELAVVGNTLYVPHDIDTTDYSIGDDSRFESVGIVLKHWAGYQQTGVGAAVVPTGEPSVTHDVRLNLHHAQTIEEVHEKCETVCAGCVKADACTVPGNPCRVYVSWGHNAKTWGHEFWHCVDGYFH